MSIKFLISCGGGASTIGVIQSLKESGRYEIVAIDAEVYSYGLKIADVGYVVPHGSSPDFAKTLEIIVQRESPRYIIPVIDEEIAAFHAVAGRCPVRVVAPVPEFCAMAFDKWLTYQALAAAGICMPDTWLAVGDPARFAYPAVIKPRSGTGSRGVAIVSGPRDVETYLFNAPQPPEAYIVQRRVIGKEFSVSVVVALGGPVLAVVPKESMIKRGMSLVAVTRRFPEIDALARRVQDTFRADGPFNLQLIVTDEGRPYVLEINPRFSGSIPLTIAAGVHEVDLVIRHAEGTLIDANVDFIPDLLMIRYHTDEYLPESCWKALLPGHDLRSPHLHG